MSTTEITEATEKILMFASVHSVCSVVNVNLGIGDCVGIRFLASRDAAQVVDNDIEFSPIHS